MFRRENYYGLYGYLKSTKFNEIFEKRFIFVVCESTDQRTDGTNSTVAQITIKSYQKIMRSSIILTVATKPKEGHGQLQSMKK